MVLKYFLLLFFGSVVFLLRLLWPLLSILILSFLLTGIFRPAYNFLNRKLSPTMSSLLTCFLIMLLVFVPLLFFLGALSQEAFGLYQGIKGSNLALKARELVEANPFIAQLREMLIGFGIDLEPRGMSDTLSEFAKGAGLFLYNQASAWAANIMNFVFSFFMMIVVIFFLLIEQERFVAFVLRLSPLPDDQERQLIKKFEEIAGAVLVGNGICGLIQGVLGGLVFAIFHLGPPVLWGGIMAILAFLPIVGIGLVLVPAALIVFLKGRMGIAVFLLIFYVLLSFSVEYALKPKLVGKRVKMHTLLVFLAILGGLQVYGVLGIIYGPLIVTAFLTLAEIYMSSYDCHVKAGLESQRNKG
ncbi:MAG: AI-2E family transporter [Deltaproteobacteria bacterium RIFOXYD12_FULL_57_12]|nr:MAG: AI-2E family transporter [Deltaproteobacteria bacterium RIFOXYD12_FULL_57_12]